MTQTEERKEGGQRERAKEEGINTPSRWVRPGYPQYDVPSQENDERNIDRRLLGERHGTTDNLRGKEDMRWDRLAEVLDRGRVAVQRSLARSGIAGL